MRLWLLKRPAADVDWDETAGYVIRAESEEAARALALADATGWNPRGIRAFADSALSTCVELTAEGEPCVILEDYKAG